ncbi:MAG: cyclase family protein [Porticoccaceae bacterium]|nr:cyclase family protein [Porticoccaceae bacterium]
MFSFDGYKAIDLSPRVSPRINRFDGSIEEGATDPYGKHWVMWEGRFPMDNSLFTMYAAPNDINLYDGRQNDDILGQERMTTHNGSHIQGGKGHISHWKGVPTDMKGLWELPLDTFIGEAAVCNLDHLKPVEVIDQSDYPKEYTKRKFFQLTADPGDMRGQEILPDYLDNIQKGDIVLMTSPFKGLEQPWLSSRTVDWLIKDRAIKMIGFGYPGIEWQYDLKVAAPKNSPIRRMFLGANIPIAHPLVNIETLSSDRVFYYGMPLNVPKLEASFVRAVAFEPQNQEDDA